MHEFNSDDHYIYYCGQESLRRKGVAIMVNKSLKCSTWMQSQKRQNDFCSFPRQTIQYHGNLSLCPNLKKLKLNGWGIDLDYCDIEWFALETNRNHSVVFEIASKYCILDSFVDHDDYSISSKGFLPTVVDIMVI